MALAKKTKPRTVKVYPFVPVEVQTWSEKEVTRRRRKNIKDKSTPSKVLAELLVFAHAIMTAQSDLEIGATLEQLRGKPLVLPTSQPGAS